MYKEATTFGEDVYVEGRVKGREVRWMMLSSSARRLEISDRRLGTFPGCACYVGAFALPPDPSSPISPHLETTAHLHRKPNIHACLHLQLQFALSSSLQAVSVFLQSLVSSQSIAMDFSDALYVLPHVAKLPVDAALPLRIWSRFCASANIVLSL